MNDDRGAMNGGRVHRSSIIVSRSSLPVSVVTVAVIVLASALPFISPLIQNEIFSFRDHADYFIPLHHFTASAIRSGDLPLWNPLNASGEPWLANPQTGVFYPPAWIFLLLPFATAYVLYLWLHILILGLGGSLLFSRWASPASSLLAAIALMLCGPTLSLLDVNNNLATFAWLPLVIWSALRPRGCDALDAAILTLSFLGGEPFLAACGALTYAVIVLVRWRSFRRIVAVGFLAALLSAFQLLPFLDLLRGSDRLSSAPVEIRDSMQPRDWLAAIVPTTDPLAGGFLDVSQQYIASVFLGLPVCLAAVIAAFLARGLERERQRLVAVCLAVFAALTIFAAGDFFAPARWLWTETGLHFSRYPARLVPLAAIAVIVMASIGFDLLFDSSRRLRVIAGTATVVVAIIAFAVFVPELRLGWRATSLFTSSLVLIIFLVFGSSRWTIWLSPLLCVDYLVSAALLLQTSSFNPTIEPYSSELRPPMKIARLFDRHDRLATQEERRAWLSGYLNLLDRRNDAWSPAPVSSANYLALHDAAIARARLDLVNFLSVGYLAAASGLNHPSYEAIAQSGAVSLYRNRNARPVAQTWTSYEVVPSASEAFQKLTATNFDANERVLVSCRPSDRCEITASEKKMSDSAVERTVISLNEIQIRVNSSEPALLTLSQQDAAGWKVMIDGVESAVLRANGIFRAVLVPAGTHEVRWVYRPRPVLMGATLSTIALVLMVWELFYVCRRRGRA